jgi:bisphosphoglycerate-independent phosphoglycerate mutase (AlkP superfamily)
MHRPSGAGDYDDDEDMGEVEEQAVDEGQYVAPMTQEDMMREEEEIRELESKKRSLEARVTGMERDLGGLMR